MRGLTPCGHSNDLVFGTVCTFANTGVVVKGWEQHRQDALFGLYGVLYWECGHCGAQWHRWPASSREAPVDPRWLDAAGNLDPEKFTDPHRHCPAGRRPSARMRAYDGSFGRVSMQRLRDEAERFMTRPHQYL